MSPTSLDRPLEIAEFLDRFGWGDAAVEPIAADFSPRRYARLTKEDATTAILMDADEDQKTPQFVLIDEVLRSIDIQVPRIVGAEPSRGLVLMDDFGDRNVGRLIDGGAAPKEFFLKATEILVALHQRFDRTAIIDADLPHYNTANFLNQVELFLDVYLPFAKEREATEEERQDFRAAWLTVLRPLEVMPKSLMLRDYMPDNLMELKDGSLGILDFQEAGTGPAIYDIASLCEEARRDGGFGLLEGVIEYYCSRSQGAMSHDDILRGCMIFSSLRHTRILGNFARAALKKGMHAKLELLPRISAHVTRTLNEPYLVPVKEWMMRVGI